ncbi:MAG TPA: hypothetical protein PK453_26670 [Leptospiraceae bacterium]|nr:hypothetical protein [Leptospiraceae bacterium]
MKILYIMLTFLFLLNHKLSSFPGDHITLTCVKHLPYAVKEGTNMEIIKDLNLIIEYNAGGNRRKDAIAKIRTALKADPAFFERPDIIAEIKQSIKDSGYNRDVPITKWGDSLSDWIDHYGWLPYSNFNYGVMGWMDAAQSCRNAELRSMMKEELARRGK